MKKAIYISLTLTVLLSCCKTQKTTKESEKMEETSFRSIITYTPLSDGRVKDEFKKQDSQYIYDYEVKDRNVKVTVSDINNLKAIVNETSNFLKSSVIRNCSPSPEIFIEIDKETVYGFFLSSNCPTFFLIKYNGSETTVEEKSISAQKIELFKTTTNKISQ